jgi:nitroimidazol reductase NimA-like FMN-containing flavoprotein (pyridoxamine 5'-phosphate oxidase superfamily)
MTSRPDYAASSPPGASPRARVRRKPGRARYDLRAAHAVLDAAPFSHVATVRDGYPVVLPMAHGRIGDTLFLHGSSVAGLFRDAGAGSPVCVTATVLDGLVFARSARNHSMNYRSVTIHGSATEVTDPDEMVDGLRAVVDHLTPGRWAEIREPTHAELRETAVWRVPVIDVSVKSRTGSTLDPESDRALPVWAGHVPVRLAFGRPIPAEGMPGDVALPSYIALLPGDVAHGGLPSTVSGTILSCCSILPGVAPSSWPGRAF